jgi:hypothetical protein
VAIDRNLEITVVSVELYIETACTTGKHVAEVGLNGEEELAWLEVLNDKEEFARPGLVTGQCSRWNARVLLQSRITSKRGVRPRNH